MKHICIILFIWTFSIQLWIGQSAQFTGRSLEYASALLGRSHNQPAYGLRALGHARKHVWGRVRQYSEGTNALKTAFDSDEDQDEVMQRMINLDRALNAAAQLNNNIPEYIGRNPYNVPIELKKQDPWFSSELLGYTRYNAPFVSGFRNGTQIFHGRRMTGAVLVLTHRRNEQLDPNAEVLVYTMFPNA